MSSVYSLFRGTLSANFLKRGYSNFCSAFISIGPSSKISFNLFTIAYFNCFAVPFLLFLFAYFYYFYFSINNFVSSSYFYISKEKN